MKIEQFKKVMLELKAPIFEIDGICCLAGFREWPGEIEIPEYFLSGVSVDATKEMEFFYGWDESDLDAIEFVK